jgi:hypothetical protein
MTDSFSDDTTVFESNKKLSVWGLPKLLRAVAMRLENSLSTSDGDLNKELLVRSAERIETLETIAIVATHIISLVPYDGENSRASKVPRATLIRLADALNQTQDFRVKRPREQRSER